MANVTPTSGDNKTGIARSAKNAKQMVEASEKLVVSEPGEAELAQRVREEYAREAEPLGSVPPPASVQQPATAAKQKAKSESPNLLVDKLGERLAFERTGVRLYQALIGKLEAYGSFKGGPEVDDLERILEEELLHFQVLERAIIKLGGDPTAVTPSADFMTNVSKGIGDVLSDPRTTFAQCLEAMLIAELADNESWEALLELAERSGDDRLVQQFQQAIEDEAEHLVNVRRWVAIAQGRR
jgi:rubrerythrin